MIQTFKRSDDFDSSYTQKQNKGFQKKTLRIELEFCYFTKRFKRFLKK